MNHLTPNDLLRASLLLKCDIPAIQAVTEVEAPRGGFNPDGTLVILFEPHIFWKELRKAGYKPEELLKKNPKLASILYPVQGTRPYPALQISRYAQIELASTISQEIAYRSASWGMFQILGNNFNSLGFSSAIKMVENFKDGEINHLLGFCKYVKANFLDDELRNYDWAGFARGYNGPYYWKNEYDIKLSIAYNKFKNEQK